MSTDNYDGGGDPGKPTRDAKGRWLPGHCPNRKGRPKKPPKVKLDQSDIWVFSNTMIDIRTNGQSEWMDRRTALYNKIFEGAMKGKVSSQRFLYKEFEQSEKQLAVARIRYQQLLLKWIIDNPEFLKPDYDLPIEVDLEIQSLRIMLNNYYPGSYPPEGESMNDDGNGDDDDGR